MNRQPNPTRPPEARPVLPEVLAVMPRHLPNASAEELAELANALRERTRRGVETYGDALHAPNGRDFLRDLTEELLDAAQYAMGLQMAGGGTPDGFRLARNAARLACGVLAESAGSLPVAPADAERVDRILATCTPGGVLREEVLADEVRRLRAALDAAEVAAELAAADVERRVTMARIEGARMVGCHTFGCPERPEHYALVSPSARPDCPPGHRQVTRLDADGPMGHTYAAPDGVAAELYSLGFTVPRGWVGGVL